MLTLRPAHERMHTDLGWLDSWHTFSFGEHYDPAHMSFRALRVINDDRVAPGAGFGLHPHRDMEIITVVLAGALEHRDSLKNGSTIKPGEVQRISAGTGILHSEYNPSADEPVHFLQIWLVPEQNGLRPSYEQTAFAPEELRGNLKLIAAREPQNSAVKVHQDVRLFTALLAAGDHVEHTLSPDRHAWLQVATGSVIINGSSLVAGDGAAISEEEVLTLQANEESQVLLFDLA